MRQKPAEHESVIEKLLRRQLEGLHVYFAKVSNVPFDLKIRFGKIDLKTLIIILEEFFIKLNFKVKISQKSNFRPSS